MEQDKELFEDYEIRGFQLSPRIYQILGISAVAHVFAIFIFAQFNLLQTKACDSPYVGKVCQVLDAAYLSAVLLGEDNDFTSEDYKKTEIAEAEDITYIDVSRAEPPLEYPPGYFALANPESQLMNDPMMPSPDFNGGFTPNGSSPTRLDLNQPQILPTPNNSVGNQPLPDSPFDFGGDTGAVKPPRPARAPSYPRPPRSNYPRVRPPRPPRNNSPGKLPALDGEETAKNSNANANTNSQTTAQNNANKNANANSATETPEDRGKFNQKPLKVFGATYGDRILSKEIDINAPFTIEVIAKLDENGNLVDAKMVTAKGSDPKMSEVAVEAIKAFSDSKLLRPLYDAGGRDVKITFAQDKDNLQAIIQTQAKDEAIAKRIYSGVNVAMTLAKTLRKGSDEANLMEKAQLATQGKIFIINFVISNEEKTQMIQKSLQNLKKEQETKAQSNSGTANAGKNSVE